MNARLAFLLASALLLGCRQGDPEPAHNANLGTADRPLLPLRQGYMDPSILEGGRAQLIELPEYREPDAAPAADDLEAEADYDDDEAFGAEDDAAAEPTDEDSAYGDEDDAGTRDAEDVGEAEEEADDTDEGDDYEK